MKSRVVKKQTDFPLVICPCLLKFSIRVILAREWIRKFLAEKSCFVLDTPESKDPESWLTPECSRMHIEPPSAAWSFSLFLSFLFFHPLNPVHSLLLPHSVLCRFYPEAELGSCYNLTSTFLSPVTAAFARMHTGKAHVSFPPLLLFCIRQFLLIPRQSSRFFDQIMRRKRRQKKKWKKSNVQTNRWRVSCVRGWVTQRFPKIKIAPCRL